MKTRMLTVAMILGGFSAALCQVENDDVYFTKKDRVAKVTEPRQQPQRTLKALGDTNDAYQSASPVISMDGYTGRTINPDYQPGGTVAVSSSYFTPNYQPTRVNSNLNQYNNFNNFSNYNSSFGFNRFGYGAGYYSPYGLNSWGYSPYSYGGFYDPYYSNMGYSSWGYSPFRYGNGFSMYSGMYSGMGLGYGWGGGWGNGFYGNGMMSCYGYYPNNNVIIVNNADSHINRVSGKRQSRSTDFANSNTNNYTGRGSGIVSSPDQGNRGGRIASNGSSNTYYQRGWRQDPTVNPTGFNSGSRTSGYSIGTGGSRSAWGAFDNTPTRGNSGLNNSSFTPSRGSFGGGSIGGGSSGGRSSGSSSGGSSSGGTRGRN